jgi:hypothetical protein
MATVRGVRELAHVPERRLLGCRLRRGRRGLRSACQQGGFEMAHEPVRIAPADVMRATRAHEADIREE